MSFIIFEPALECTLLSYELGIFFYFPICEAITIFYTQTGKCGISE